MPEHKSCYRTCVLNGGLLYFYLQFLIFVSLLFCVIFPLDSWLLW